MGRKWANIKEKSAKDANNSRVYAKFGIEIYVARSQETLILMQTKITVCNRTRQNIQCTKTYY